MRVDHLFGIKHYAGDVEYDTRGIIEKNRDNLPQEGVDLLMSSEIPFTVVLGTIEANKNATPEASPKSSSSGGGRRGGTSKKWLRVFRFVVNFFFFFCAHPPLFLECSPAAICVVSA